MNKLQRIISAILDEFEIYNNETEVELEEHEYENYNIRKDGVYTWKHILITAVIFLIITVLFLL
ncbi:MAG: hypothetical protein AB8B53_02910 [Flavobacteriales bacterium]